MKTDELSRRKFLTNSLSVTAAVPFLALVGAAACKSEAPPAETKPADGAPAADPTPKPADGAAPSGAICDEAALSDAEKAKRTALSYVDASTTPDQSCANCNFFKADQGGCAGCTLFAGPIKPEGWCKSWVKKV